MKKIAIIIFWVSIPITILGYFLQTILIPLQDFNLISKTELKKIQMDVAINYSFGVSMMYIGLAAFVFTSIFLISNKIIR